MSNSPRKYRSLFSALSWVVIVFLSFISCGPGPDSVERRLIDGAGTREFLYNLQRAIMGNDKRRVGRLLGYPQLYTIGCEDLRIDTEEEFLAHYDEIITSDVQKVILSQEFNSLFANWRGVMLGAGEVWLTTSCDSVNAKDECIRWVTRAKVQPVLFNDPDCRQAEIDSANDVWALFSNDDALQEKSYYGTWHIIRDEPGDIACLTTATVKELRELPMELSAGKMFLDSVQFNGVSFQLRPVSVASLLGERGMERFMWRKRRGLLADSLILLTVDYAAKPKVLNPAKERCFDRENSVNDFWIVDANTLLWSVGGDMIVFQR